MNLLLYESVRCVMNLTGVRKNRWSKPQVASLCDLSTFSEVIHMRLSCSEATTATITTKKKIVIIAVPLACKEGIFVVVFIRESIDGEGKKAFSIHLGLEPRTSRFVVSHAIRLRQRTITIGPFKEPHII